MRTFEMRTESILLVRALAGERADRYVSDFLLSPVQSCLKLGEATIRDVRNAYADSESCLRLLFGHYAFSRRGKDRQILSDLALKALDRVLSEVGFEAFIEQPNAVNLWQAFELLCIEKRYKPVEQQNRGIIQGLAELAQEVWGLEGIQSVADWVVRAVQESDRMEPQFLRIVDIRGVGPKITSLFLRDVTFLFGLEERIERADRIYVQPIDKWIRVIAPYVIDEPNAEGMADWVLAGKITKYSRWAGVSGIRFNMGSTYCGLREIRNIEATDIVVGNILKGSASAV